MLNEKSLVVPNEDFPNFPEVCRAADYLQEATLNLGPYQLHPDPRIFQTYSYSWNLVKPFLSLIPEDPNSWPLVPMEIQLVSFQILFAQILENRAWPPIFSARQWLKSIRNLKKMDVDF